MHGHEADLKELFGNIEKGLTTYSIKEFNKALHLVLGQKSDKRVETDLALEIVCKHYEITLPTLMQHNVKGDINDAKQHAYCLLHYDIGLGVRYIAKFIFLNSPRPVSVGINRLKRVKPRIKEDDKFLHTYSILQQKLIEKIISIQTTYE